MAPDGDNPKHKGEPSSDGATPSSGLSSTSQEAPRVFDNTSPRALRKISATACSGVPGVIGGILIVSFLHRKLEWAVGPGQRDDDPGALVRPQTLPGPRSPTQPAIEPESQDCKPRQG